MFKKILEANEINNFLIKEGMSKLQRSWFNEKTLDKWRHNRMMNPLKAFITKNSTWLTIGDGRFGTEAHFILKEGGKAHASDIETDLLKISKEIGYIDDYSFQNAEDLNFKDSSFDYILIKEACHHFEKPWIGLYEAFRVAKKGLVLIEPQDNNSYHYGLRKKSFVYFKNAIKILLNKPSNTESYSFEVEGKNFVYTLNNRELEKFLLSMNINHYAFREINDYYFPGVEFIENNPKNLIGKLIKLKLKTNIFTLDVLSNFGFVNKNLIQIILFKEVPNKKTLEKMYKSNWNYKILPKNPYL